MASFTFLCQKEALDTSSKDQGDHVMKLVKRSTPWASCFKKSAPLSSPCYSLLDFVTWG